jgi:Histidine kinase-, DNA gyrase B-, and HSP90-like ATPase
MHSLRDMGYDLPAALADLLDNSIDAGARCVTIDLGTDWRGSYLRVADDGGGMTERVLEEAMRYGSSRHYTTDDLGNFGLGLKTASLSHCKRLTVATRTTRKGPIRIRRWDLDHIAQTDAWLLERPRRTDAREELVQPLSAGPGTVVLWEKLDRIMGSRRPGGQAALRKAEQVATELRLHLGMIFHRFLAGEVPGRRLRLLINGDPVHPWDPYALDEPLTQRLPLQHLAFEHDGQEYSAVVRPYVLPQQHQFSSSDAHDRAGGPNRWNRQQGLYIYRRDRLIQSGSWNRLRTMDEHSKLARIALDIPPGADEAFHVDVAKMSVGLPDDLRTRLRVLAAAVVAVAQEAYRRPRLVVVDERPESLAPSLSLGDQWPMIVEVLERELADQPELLDRILIALVNARPGAVRPAKAAGMSAG